MSCTGCSFVRSTDKITVSVVSHGQASLVSALLTDLVHCAEVETIIITYNVPEERVAAPPSLENRITHLFNPSPHGFGANHNGAFRRCETAYFCVLNPDIRLPENPFFDLLRCLKETDAVFVAPTIVNPRGEIEDSARLYPTPFALLQRAFFRRGGKYPLSSTRDLVQPDWIAGMFMLFRTGSYAAFGGFDEGYFLYCEDTDLCARIRRAGSDFLLCPNVSAIHDARRASRRSFRHMYWHTQSMFRFFLKHTGRLSRREGTIKSRAATENPSV